MLARDIRIMGLVSGIAKAAVGSAKLDLDDIDNLVETLFATMHKLLDGRNPTTPGDKEYFEVMEFVSGIATSAVENVNLKGPIDKLITTVFAAMCKLLEESAPEQQEWSPNGGRQS